MTSQAATYQDYIAKETAPHEAKRKETAQRPVWHFLAFLDRAPLGDEKIVG